MKFPENRGQHMRKVQEKNRAAIIRFYTDNPQGTQEECSKACGVSVNTVYQHIKAIRGKTDA